MAEDAAPAPAEGYDFFTEADQLLLVVGSQVRLERQRAAAALQIDLDRAAGRPTADGTERVRVYDEQLAVLRDQRKALEAAGVSLPEGVDPRRLGSGASRPPRLAGPGVTGP